MKIIRERLFLNEGDFSKSEDFQVILNELRQAILHVTTDNEEKFLINPVRTGNGVMPIKRKFISYLEHNDWRAEIRMSFADGMNPGPVDIIKETNYGLFAVEWETGNISSSHRALNKIAIGILQKAVIGGILILPSKKLASYLTDRIGNYEELEPYFTLYENVVINSAVMGVIVVEHDDETNETPLIPKGKDGNALKMRKKRLAGS